MGHGRGKLGKTAKLTMGAGAKRTKIILNMSDIILLLVTVTEVYRLKLRICPCPFQWYL